MFGYGANLQSEFWRDVVRSVELVPGRRYELELSCGHRCLIFGPLEALEAIGNRVICDACIAARRARAGRQ